MKRYLLFAGDNPQGGWRDIAGDFDSIEEARVFHPTRVDAYPEIPGQWVNLTEDLPPAIAEVVPDKRMIMPVLQLVDGDILTFWQAHQRGIRLDDEGIHDVVNLAGIIPEQRVQLQVEIDRYAEAPSSDHVWFFQQPAETIHRACRHDDSPLAWQHIVDGHTGEPVAQWTEDDGWVQDPEASSGLIIASAGTIPHR